MISIVIPTYNASETLPTLIRQVFEVCAHARVKAEVIVIDDNSPDGTGELVYYMRKFYPRLKTLHREHRLGKASAILEGFRAAQGSIVGTVSANLDHPPLLIPHLLRPLIAGHVDLTVGSRYYEGSQESPSLRHSVKHHLLRMFYHPVLHLEDPLSDFFFLRKDLLQRSYLNDNVPHLLPEILLNCHYRSVQEVPYGYQRPPVRAEGRTGLKSWLDYLSQLAILYKARFLTR